MRRKKKKTENVEPESSKVTARKSNEEEYQILEDKYRDILPKNWGEMSMNQRLDWFGHRMILEIREDIRKKHGNKAARDTGLMSEYQLERRRRREVQSKLGGWDEIPPTAGNFYRKYIDPNRISDVDPREDNNGQKNP